MVWQLGQYWSCLITMTGLDFSGRCTMESDPRLYSQSKCSVRNFCDNQHSPCRWNDCCHTIGHTKNTVCLDYCQQWQSTIQYILLSTCCCWLWSQSSWGTTTTVFERDAKIYQDKCGQKSELCRIIVADSTNKELEPSREHWMKHQRYSYKTMTF